MKNIKPIISTSVTKQIAEQIRSAIIKGEFAKGDRLPTETELAAMYGVSRPSIREAFKRLAAQNLIRARRGPAGGTFISDYTIEDASEIMISSTMLMLSLNSIDVEDVVDIRLFMEKQCCNLALQNWSPEIAQNIEEAYVHLTDTALTDEEFCEADVRFHRSIVQASGNKMLAYLMYSVNESLVPVMNMMIVYVRDREVILSHYAALKKALFSGNKTGSEQALEELMVYLKAQIKHAQKLRAEKK